MRNETILVNIFGMEMKMGLTDTAVNTCPEFNYQESDNTFALRSVKFFLEGLNEDLLDDVKLGQRIVIDNSVLAAELVFGEDSIITVTKFIEKNQIEKYVNKHGVTTFRASNDNLLSA